MLSGTKLTQTISDLVSQDKWDDAFAILSRFDVEEIQDAETLCQLSRLAAAIGKFAICETLITAALRLDPQRSTMQYELGLCLLQQNRAAEAINAFRTACELQSDFALGHLYWGIALLQMGNLRGAVGQFHQANKLNPQLAAAHYLAGVSGMRLGIYQEALAEFEQACKANPKFAMAVNAKGLCALALGDLSGAAAFFSRACELDPTLTQAQANLASTLAQLGWFDQAFDHYRKALAADAASLPARERALIYNNWGVSLYLAGLGEEAADKLKQACDIEVNLFEWQINLGLVYLALREFDLAAAIFEKIVAADPSALTALMYCGVSDLLLNKPDPALSKLLAANKRGLSSEELILWLAYSYLSLGDAGAAQKLFESLLRSNASDYIALDGLGSCLALAGNNQAALKEFDRCLQVNPNYGLGQLHRARSLEALGLKDQALAAYEKALGLDPNCLLAEKEMIERLLQDADFAQALLRSLKVLEIDAQDQTANLAVARTLKVQGRLDQALAICQSLIANTADNNKGAAYSACGEIYVAQGNLVEADEMFRQASQRNEDDATLFLSWGKALSLLGFYELALEKFAKAAQIDPYNGDIYELWGNTLKLLGRFPEAAEVFKTAASYL